MCNIFNLFTDFYSFIYYYAWILVKGIFFYSEIDDFWLTLSPMGGGLRAPPPPNVFAIAQEPWYLGPSNGLLFLKPSWANDEIKISFNSYFLPPYEPPKEVHPEESLLKTSYFSLKKWSFDLYANDFFNYKN